VAADTSVFLNVSFVTYILPTFLLFSDIRFVDKHEKFVFLKHDSGVHIWI